MIKLVQPDIRYTDTIKDYMNAYLEYYPASKEDGIQGSAYLMGFDSISEWVENCKFQSTTTNLEAGRVNATTFLTIDTDTCEMVGIVNIRHELNGYLMNVGGHIGYSIKPNHFGKGYGKQQLKLALDYCREVLKLESVLVTCDVDNIASFKVIQALGGIQENVITYENEDVSRNWITL